MLVVIFVPVSSYLDSISNYSSVNVLMAFNVFYSPRGLTQLYEYLRLNIIVNVVFVYSLPRTDCRQASKKDRGKNQRKNEISNRKEKILLKQMAKKESHAS